MIGDFRRVLLHQVENSRSLIGRDLTSSTLSLFLSLALLVFSRSSSGGNNRRCSQGRRGVGCGECKQLGPAKVGAVLDVASASS